MKDVYIADFAAHEDKQITSFFVATQKQVRTKKDGNPYLAFILSDRTGQVEARMWDNVTDCIPLFEQGEVVKVRAFVCRFDGRLQLKVERIRRAPQGEFDLGDFLPKTTKERRRTVGWNSTPTSPASRIRTSRRLLNSFLNDEQIAAALAMAPAAKGMHHAWIGGLLEHIVSLLGIADLAAGHYTEINRDLLLTGVVLHDIGKAARTGMGARASATRWKASCWDTSPSASAWWRRSSKRCPTFLRNSDCWSSTDPEPSWTVRIRLAQAAHDSRGGPAAIFLMIWTRRCSLSAASWSATWRRAVPLDQFTDWVRPMERALLESFWLSRAEEP